jgi:uncharacterized membrane protein
MLATAIGIVPGTFVYQFPFAKFGRKILTEGLQLEYLNVVGVDGARVVAAGVALFVALPVLRVLVMLGAFILNQDYRHVIAATAVLMTILAGLVIGLSSSNPLAH